MNIDVGLSWFLCVSDLSSWSGNTRIWEIPAVKRAAVLKGHIERVTGVAFHPEACRSLSA